MISKKVSLVSMLAIAALVFATAATVVSTAEVNKNQHKQDSFSQWPGFGEGEDWRYLIFDGNSGNIAVNGPTTFDNSTAEVTQENQLHFSQAYDPDFDAEYPYQYNNVFMIGFQGYQPDPQKDVVWSYEMKIEPGVYGTTGFVVERKDTFTPAGTFALPFDFFGVSYAGEENFNPGLQCSSVVNWAPVSQVPINGVDPFQWNDYEIRFHFVDSATVQASISVNKTEVCQATLANYGETEVQLWLDNYKVTLDPASPVGYTIGFNNQETPQGIFFDNISVKTKPSH
jgi:hypothetical protein